MRIVFILTEIAIGGAERVVLDLGCELKKKGHEVFVIALKKLNHNDIMVQSFQREGIELISLNLSKYNPFRAFLLRKKVFELAPDIVSAHLFHPNILSRLLLGNRKFKLINTIHIMEIRKKEKWRFVIDRMTFKKANVHTAVSQAAADFQMQNLKLPANSIKVIRNGINLPQKINAETKNELHQKWGVSDCDTVLGCVGRLNYQKGFDILLRMTENISKILPDRKIALVFIGDGPELENLKKLAQNAPARMQIVFAGYSASAASECGAFDVFLMPSRFEGFGLTLLEAASHGLPIVAQDIPPLREVIADYPNAIISDFTSPDTAAADIAEAANLKRIDYTPATAEKMTDEYLQIFEPNTD